MKKCIFKIEAFFGIPIDYENWFEDMEVELTEEQFDRYCETLERWHASDDYKKWNNENGEDYFIKRDLPDIYQIIIDKLKTYAPQVWDERIMPYLDQVNIFTADEIWESCQFYKIQDMETFIIPTYLREVEKEHNVKILLAVESGSRAWGFESKDSDWDVRFIYVHNPEWYFKIDEQRDVIEKMTDSGLDLVGWELRKALRLLKKSNTSMLEWFNSPKIYKIDREFAELIREVENVYFNPIHAIYHYNHVYNKHNERYLQREDCSMKRFLYYLRGVLACKWIEERLSLPPVRFMQLVDAIVDDVSIRKAIYSLIEIKKTGVEQDLAIVDKRLVEYAKNLADYYNDTIDSFRPQCDKVSSDALDEILFEMVNRSQKQ